MCLKHIIFLDTSKASILMNSFHSIGYSNYLELFMFKWIVRLVKYDLVLGLFKQNLLNIRKTRPLFAFKDWAKR